MTMTKFETIRRTAFTLGSAALIAALSACELEVSNPGPVQADALEDPKALTSVVNGAGRDLAEAINWTAYTGGAVALEIFPGGSTGSFGITPRQQQGKLVDDDDDTHWNFSQRARWTAEDAVARGKTVLGAAAANNATVAQALVWAGFANRHLGENFCEGVINGGAPQPYTVYLERAEANFTEAITVAGAANNANLVSAATAGRASVRLLRNNLTGAAADAAAILSPFTYRMPYFSTDLDQYNRIYWASANQPYRAHTVWNTFYDSYRKSTRDPRVPFDSSDAVGGRRGGRESRTRALVLPDEIPGAIFTDQPGERLGDASHRGRGEAGGRRHSGGDDVDEPASRRAGPNAVDSGERHGRMDGTQARAWYRALVGKPAAW